MRAYSESAITTKKSRLSELIVFVKSGIKHSNIPQIKPIKSGLPVDTADIYWRGEISVYKKRITSFMQ